MSSPRLSDIKLVEIPVEDRTILGDLDVPAKAKGLVIFAHGLGSGRASPRNIEVGGRLRRANMATLRLDLLTPEEAAEDAESGVHRFDIDLLAERIVAATLWAGSDPETAPLPVGFFGSSTGASGALAAAARLPGTVAAVVSRGGRPDLAMTRLRGVKAATLLVVGGRDYEVIRMNRAALTVLGGPRRLEIVPGAGHLFEEPGTLASASELAAEWFERYLVR